VGLVVSIVAMRRIDRDQPRGRRPAIFGVACGALLTGLLVVFVWPNIAFQENAAHDEVRAFVASVRSDGGRKLCDNGDSGHGIDNRQPWYDAYFDIADRPRLTDEIKADAARAGYPLRQDTEEIASLKAASGPLVDQPKFNPEADYLVSSKNGNRLDVTIDRDTAVPLYCGVEHYGERKQTGAGAAIVTISMELPDR
jgi:hypothetical protein